MLVDQLAHPPQQPGAGRRKQIAPSRIAQRGASRSDGAVDVLSRPLGDHAEDLSGRRIACVELPTRDRLDPLTADQ